MVAMWAMMTTKFKMKVVVTILPEERHEVFIISSAFSAHIVHI